MPGNDFKQTANGVSCQFGRITVLALMLALNAAAQSHGTFALSGFMSTYRNGFTGALLKDGRILLAGGLADKSNQALDSAEIFDPSTETFRNTGRMIHGRAGACSILLRDGRVLIVGGGAAEAELFDPATETFGPAGATSLRGGLLSFEQLGDGRVLMVSESIEIYDPATNQFKLVTTSNPDFAGPAILLDSVHLLEKTLGSRLSLFNISAGKYDLVGSAPGGEYYFQTATILANGKVLVAAGGKDDGEFTTDQAFLFDPLRATTQSTGSLAISRYNHSATLLPGGHVLFAGGYSQDDYNNGYNGLATAEEYDPSQGVFLKAGDSQVLRAGHWATLLLDGRVFIAGGKAGTDTEIYTPQFRTASAASFDGPVTPDSLASLFGSRLARTVEVGDSLAPPTALGGISLRIGGQLAPLLYVSPSQINFVVPRGIALGKQPVEVLNAAAAPPPIVAQVDNVAPALFTFANNLVAAYALRIEPDGHQTLLSLGGEIVPDSRPLYLIAFGTGIRNLTSASSVRCFLDEQSMAVEYAGPSGTGIGGLDQVNIRIPPDFQTRGPIDISLFVDGVRANTVSLILRPLP